MLLTKLHIPSLGKSLVHRQNIFIRLNEGLSRKLILISAPAGFGKSTAVSDWISETKIPAAWFSLDKGDNDPVEFLSYIISSIQTLEKDFGQSALELLNSPSHPEAESIINLLINDFIDIKNNILLVLDDFHLISNIEISKLVSYLIEYMPDNLHIAILSRSDPSIPLARLRSQQQLVELRSKDLSFSSMEISSLFNKKFKIKLSHRDIHSLEAKTEGWIAGLQLIALSITDKEDISGFIQTLKGDNKYIMDYLIEEVLKIQSEEIKEFLLMTSMFKQFSAALCDEVLNRNNSQIILEKLEKNNMFVVPLDSERHWYRYHHLFSDLLKQRQINKDKSIVEEIHNKASIWFEQNNMFELAIDHSLEVKNYERSIKLVSQIVEQVWLNGQHNTIMKYGDLIPDELIKTNPDFCLYYSWILIVAGQVNKAEPYLHIAEKTTKKLINEKKQSHDSIHKKLLGKISVAYAYLYSHKEPSEKIFNYCNTAMVNLSKDDPFWYSWAWFSYGIAYFSVGNLKESEKAFNLAFEYAKKNNNIYLISTIVIRLAESEQQLGNSQSAYKRCSDLLELMNERGYLQVTKTEWTYAGLYLILGVTQLHRYDMDNAYENIKIAYELSQKGNDVFLKVFTLIIYTTILKERKDNRAEEKINELENIIKINTITPFLYSYYLVWKIYLLIERKQFEQANQLILDCGLELHKEKNHSNEFAYAALTRLLLEQNELEKAESLIDELHTIAISSKRKERLIETNTSYAVLNNLKGNFEKAVSYMTTALEIASHEEYLFFFVIDSERINNILEGVYRNHSLKQTKIPTEFLDKLKNAIKKREIFNKINNFSGLSSRELDTLKLIAEDLTNQQISDKLFISLNTTKTHVRNILLKLEVENRSKAVAKAKEKGII